MRITFHGAARSVTGSRHLLELNGTQVLLDCGMVQGRRSESEDRNRQLGFNAKDLTAVVLSHAHIDHSGALPSLVKAGYRGPIHATPATADLAAVMLEDSAVIQERDVELVNRREGIKKQPLYTIQDARQVAQQFRRRAYWQPLEVAPGVRLTFHEAGHMLGSSMVKLELEEKGRKRTLVFTGDIGRPIIPMIRPPEIPTEGDALIIESTYGNRKHPPDEDLKKEFSGLVRRVYDRRGKLIIPAFAVGRTQHITYILNTMTVEGTFPNMPVFIDSPLAAETTEIFKRHPECYDEKSKAEIARDPDHDPLGFRLLQYTKTPEQSKRLNDLQGSAIIIAASGMCEHGRILHHLYYHGRDPKNVLLFVGYQAEHTLGRKIVEGARHVMIHGQEVDLRAEVVRMEGFSAHADRPALESFVRGPGAKLKDVFVVHGEPDQSDAFAGWIKQATGARTLVPGLGMQVNL